MDHYDRELETRVDRKYKPLARVIWSGFISGAIWIILIVGLISGFVNAQFLVGVGLLSLLLPAMMGIQFAQQMIKIGMIEEEEKRMAALGLLEKRKHSDPDTVRLSDDGEPIEVDEYLYEEDALSHHTAEY